MDEKNFLAGEFEANRGHLRAVAYRMLGSTAEVDDAVQETWLRLSRSDTSAVANPGGRSRWDRTYRSPSPATNMSAIRRWPIPLAPPCWWCWKRWRRPNGWP